MIIIGEKINGTRKAVARAIRERDTDFIQDLAKSQAEAGSHYLDVNAGTAPGREAEDMAWLVDTVQDVCDTPLCLDSANPAALRAGLELVKAPPMINSVSGEKPRIEGVLPLALEFKTNLILLALDDETGIPTSCEGRMKIVDRLVGLAKDGGLAESTALCGPPGHRHQHRHRKRHDHLRHHPECPGEVSGMPHHQRAIQHQLRNAPPAPHQPDLHGHVRPGGDGQRHPEPQRPESPGRDARLGDAHEQGSVLPEFQQGGTKRQDWRNDKVASGGLFPTQLCGTA
jgi:hypothetical protein